MSASEADDEAKKLEEDRTNSMGFFNTAEAFRLSAIALEASKVKIGHADKPIRVLTYHALELYRTAMLRQSHNTETIKRKFGHDTKRLMEEAEMFGFAVTDEDRDVLSRIADTEAVIEAPPARRLAPKAPGAADGNDDEAEGQIDHDDLADSIDADGGGRPVLRINRAFEC